MNKRILHICIFLLTAPCFAMAQDGGYVNIDAVSVYGRRPLKDIGVQRTELDSTMLRENITNSLADVLSQNTAIFIKSYGRATLATASFRGTAPSHTQVTWNGMKLNSPMLGMVDFSLIPSYFIDDANLYHGASSTGVTGGGLGGAIALGTKPAESDGLDMRFIQGVGSYSTIDEFLKLTYGGKKWRSATRVYYTSSDNDFKYTNPNKKDFIYGENNEIIGYTRPKERNKNGSYKDFHIMQELYYSGARGSEWSLSAWYMDSRRGVPMLNVNWRDEDRSETRQNENTLRTTIAWVKRLRNLKMEANGGYTYTDLDYKYMADNAGELQKMIHSRSYVNTGFARFGTEYYMGRKWIFTASLSGHQHFVKSLDNARTPGEKKDTVVGYDMSRSEFSAFASVRFKPTDRWGFAVNLREESYGSDFTPLIPAVFAEYLISPRYNWVVKASGTRNYRYPTLNDLYFIPGGNPDLKSEKGFSYDVGTAISHKGNGWGVETEVTAFDSYIKDWIVWLPTFKGFWEPDNVKKVHSYGLEAKARTEFTPSYDWHITLGANYTLTKAINKGDRMNWADESIGKQLVYIPEHSASVNGGLRWKTWSFLYKWNYYSERFTTSSNETQSKLNRVSPYFMSDISLEKTFDTKFSVISLKAAVNNLFDEEYESVLSRPMAGRNYGIFIELRPKLQKRKK